MNDVKTKFLYKLETKAEQLKKQSCSLREKKKIFNRLTKN